MLESRWRMHNSIYETTLILTSEVGIPEVADEEVLKIEIR